MFSEKNEQRELQEKKIENQEREIRVAAALEEENGKTAFERSLKCFHDLLIFRLIPNYYLIKNVHCLLGNHD